MASSRIYTTCPNDGENFAMTGNRLEAALSMACVTSVFLEASGYRYIFIGSSIRSQTCTAVPNI